jgi:hypothetical protein
MDLYIHSPIRLHGVVLKYLSTGTTLLFIIIPPASAEVKKMWIYTSAPAYAFMA